MKKSIALLSLGLMFGNAALAGGAGGPTTAAPAATTCRTIADLIMNDPQFSTLLTAVQATGLTETLQGGSYTVFAPTDAAFAKLPSDALSNLFNDPDQLKSILLYHVLPGKVNATQVKVLKSAKTANGATVSVSTMGSKVMINNATVTRANVLACNGIVHVIDTVLMPPMATVTPAPAATTTPATPEPAPAAAPAATTPSAPAGISVADIPVTPLSGATTASTTDTSTTTDTTTPSAPADTTTTDTTATDTTTTTDATTDTTTTDATTTDTTTTDATTTEATTTDTSADASATTTDETASNTVYDVIASDERFSTLAGLISDAGLDETLMTGDYTIFAPTNEAFDKVDPDTLAVIASDPALLKQILLYHVVAGKVPASQVATSTQLTSAEGSSLSVMASGSSVMVGTANVTATDIASSNGVIHAIDAVLIPSDVTIPAPPAVAADTSTTDAAATPSTPATTDAAATPSTPATTDAAAATPSTPATTDATTPSAPAAAATPAAPATATPAATSTVAQLISTDPRFSTLNGLLQQSGLAATLGGAGPFTVFAPTNDAFAKLTPTQLSDLTSNPTALARVLSYHVVSGSFTASDAAAQGVRTTTSDNAPLQLVSSGGNFMIGSAMITQADIPASNGYIDAIDTVLMPPALP
ncbi:fasciclin domain-containing protein [Deinococcus sonorensis]|uniref:Fasciclin domain-containing protein n=2 Tax=Deinococcus sonorensis TaxID=309891 RepID=A0AAU7U9X5_9DEIO